MNIWCDLHFNKGVRITIGVHGSQMGAAYDANHQAALLCVVAQRHQDAAALEMQANSSVRQIGDSVGSKFLKTYLTFFHNKHGIKK